MSKKKNITLCAAMLFCMAVLTGCGGENPPEQQKELQAEEENPASGQDAAQTGGEEIAAEQETAQTDGEEVAADQRDPAVREKRLTEFWQRWKEKKAGISRPPEQDPLPYPKIAVIPMDLRECTVAFSEGCYCIYDGSCYGFITAEGEEISPFLFEEAYPFSEGLACVRSHGKYGFIGMDGETVLPFVYDEAAPFTDGLAYFRIGEEYGFMDHEGNVILQPDCDSVSSFWEGRAYFTVDGLYGYMDTEGKIIAEPVYEDAGHFQDGLAKVIRNGMYGMIGRDGEEILPPEYDAITVRKDGYIIVQKDGLEYCFDETGRQCMEEGWDWIYIRNGLFTVTGEEGKGLIDSEGRVLFEPKYEYLDPVPGKELVIMELDGFYGVVDYEGRTRIPFAYDDIFCESGGFTVKVDGKYGYLAFSREDEWDTEPELYTYVSFFEGDRAYVRTDEKYGVIDKDGNLEIPARYGRIRLLENGSLTIRTEKITALYDREDKLIASGLYDVIYARGRGYLTVKDSKYGFLDERGETLLEPVCRQITADGYSEKVIALIRRGEEGIESLLVNTDEEEEKSTQLQKLLFQNHITPRAGEYLEFLKSGAVTVKENGGEERTVAFDDFRTYRRLNKLYLIDGEVVLSFFAQPTPESGYLSESGFFLLRDGKLTELVLGHETGGAERGNRIRFWYDTETGKRMLGIRGSWEATGATGSDTRIYELNGSRTNFYALGENAAEQILSCQSVDYLLGEDYVTDYWIDDIQVTEEAYSAIWKRYRYLEMLDLDF
ncbi:MAG: WG repeat-containing protein [bacterium]|nr:WG repeat-containing protein [bacterium]